MILLAFVLITATVWKGWQLVPPWPPESAGRLVNCQQMIGVGQLRRIIWPKLLIR